MHSIAKFLAPSASVLALTLGAQAFADTKPAAAAPAAGATEFVIDAAHTTIGFEIAHLVISTVEGRFNKFEGSFFLPEKPAKDNQSSMKVSTTVQTDSIDTGVAKRDDHLRSPDFFDSKKFAAMKFVSKSVDVVSEKKWKLNGELTIRDVTKPVTFDVDYKGQVMANDKKHAAFKATAEINRKDFGLVWNNLIEAGPAVGDMVAITLNVEGIRKSDAAH